MEVTTNYLPADLDIQSNTPTYAVEIVLSLAAREWRMYRYNTMGECTGVWAVPRTWKARAGVRVRVRNS